MGWDSASLSASGATTRSAAGVLDLRFALFGAALVLGVAGRLVCGWGAPLWFDETFSATIATQPDARHLIDWCLHELTGPAYYMPLWAWAKLAGSSDVALRLPSLALSVAAPVLLYWKGHRDPDIRLFWAVLAALWMPGLLSAGDARPYALLFLLGCAQAMAFLRLMRAPRLDRALLWATISALAILTHYHGIVIAGLQGLAYLAVHRRAALRTWPAVLPLVPMAAWMALHVPYVLGYATSGSTWYEVLPPSDVIALPRLLFGTSLHGGIILAVIGVTLVRTSRTVPLMSLARLATPEVALMLTGVLAVAIIFGTAFIRPSFSGRYLTSAIPAILFGVALWAQWTLHRPGKRDVKPAAIVVAMLFFMALGAIKFEIDQPQRNVHRDFNFEQASGWLEERAPRRLIFFWDNATGVFSDPGRLGDAAGFFFRRAGHPLVTAVPRFTPGKDMTVAIDRLAGADRTTAVLWIVSGYRVSAHLPMLQGDPQWECRDFGGETTIVLACRRPA